MLPRIDIFSKTYIWKSLGFCDFNSKY